MVNYIQVAILILLDFVVQCKFERNLLFKLKSRNPYFMQFLGDDLMNNYNDGRNPYFTRFCCAIKHNS